MYLGNDRDEWRETYSEATVKIKLNNVLQYEKRANINRLGYKTVPIATSFILSANTTHTISFEISNSGALAVGQEFVFLIGNI